MSIHLFPVLHLYALHFCRVKAAGAWGCQPYRNLVPTVFKSGTLSLLGPCGPSQACIRIALPCTHKLVKRFRNLDNG